MPAVKALQVGDIAPDFALPSPTGETVRLSDFRGKSAVVLFFYPKDNSPACTAQACSFRDSFEAFQQAGATVIGISGDSEGSHRLFAKLWKLPFILLSDRRGAKSIWRAPNPRHLPRPSHVLDRSRRDRPACLFLGPSAEKTRHGDAPEDW